MARGIDAAEAKVRALVLEAGMIYLEPALDEADLRHAPAPGPGEPVEKGAGESV